MKHIMLDLETMGTASDAPIIAIGACFFDPGTGAIGEVFYTPVRLQSAVDAGARIDPSTVLWWLGQSDAARAKFANNEGAPDLGMALDMFRNFVGHNKVQVWGNGSGFDNTILSNAYKSTGSYTPWSFWADRDVRTMVELGQAAGIDPKATLPFTGTPHYAVDDAIHQAKYVSIIWQHLTGGRTA